MAEVCEERAALAGRESVKREYAVAAGGCKDDVGPGETGLEGNGGEAEVGRGESGRRVDVADLDSGAEGAGGVGNAAADGTVADDEDRLVVERERPVTPSKVLAATSPTRWRLWSPCLMGMSSQLKTG